MINVFKYSYDIIKYMKINVCPYVNEYVIQNSVYRKYPIEKSLFIYFYK